MEEPLFRDGIQGVTVIPMDERTPKMLKRGERWIDRQILRGVPEYHLFQSDADRYNAVAELNHDLEATRTFTRTNVAIAVVGVLLANISLALVPAVSPWSFSGQGWIGFGVFILSIPFFIVWFWRRAIKKQLRAKLIEAGVPVCRTCGYAMQRLSTPRCPECGWVADEQVRALIVRE